MVCRRYIVEWLGLEGKGVGGVGEYAQTRRQLEQALAGRKLLRDYAVRALRWRHLVTATRVTTAEGPQAGQYTRFNGTSRLVSLSVVS